MTTNHLLLNKDTAQFIYYHNKIKPLTQIVIHDNVCDFVNTNKILGLTLFDTTLSIRKN